MFEPTSHTVGGRISFLTHPFLQISEFGHTGTRYPRLTSNDSVGFNIFNTTKCTKPVTFDCFRNVSVTFSNSAAVTSLALTSAAARTSFDREITSSKAQLDGSTAAPWYLSSPSVNLPTATNALDVLSMALESTLDSV